MTAAAFEKPLLMHGIPASADYHTNQYHAVTISSDTIVLASTAGQKVFGILQDQPESGEHGTIMLQGISKAVFGGTVTEGAALTCDSSGHLVARTSDDTFFVGWALQAAVANDVKAVFLPGIQPSGDDLVEGAVQYAEVALTSAEILALYTTPKSLVAAPGAGYILEFLSGLLILDHGGTDYATNGDLTIKFTNGSGTAVSDTVAAADLVQKSADATRIVQALSADVAGTVNAALVLTCGTGNPATGNGVIRVKVAYRVHKTDL